MEVDPGGEITPVQSLREAGDPPPSADLAEFLYHWLARPAPDVFELAGGLPLPEAAELLDLDLGSAADTIGGYIVSALGRLPSKGDKIEIPPYRATGLEMSRRRVARVRFEKLPEKEG